MVVSFRVRNPAAARPSARRVRPRCVARRSRSRSGRAGPNRPNRRSRSSSGETSPARRAEPGRRRPKTRVGAGRRPSSRSTTRPSGTATTRLSPCMKGRAGRDHDLAGPDLRTQVDRGGPEAQIEIDALHRRAIRTESAQDAPAPLPRESDDPAVGEEPGRVHLRVLHEPRDDRRRRLRSGGRARARTSAAARRRRRARSRSSRRSGEHPSEPSASSARRSPSAR